jgi:hypothetical protein
VGEEVAAKPERFDSGALLQLHDEVDDLIQLLEALLLSVTLRSQVAVEHGPVSHTCDQSPISTPITVRAS